MSISIAQAIRDGGSDFSKMVDITITAYSPDTESRYFLVSKAITATAGTSYSDLELLAICSPEDIATYGTTQIPSGAYRTNQGTFYFPDSTKLQYSLSSITADIADAVSAYRKSIAPTGIFTAGTTGTLNTTPSFSDYL